MLVFIDRSHTFLLTIARAGFALLLLTAAFECVPGQQSANLALPFSRGEELVYQTEFNRGLLHGVDVAEFRFSASTSRVVPKDAAAGDPVVMRLVGDVASKGFFTRLAGFHFHQYVTFYFLCSLWGLFMFLVAEAYDQERKRGTLDNNEEMLRHLSENKEEIEARVMQYLKDHPGATLTFNVMEELIREEDRKKEAGN